MRRAVTVERRVLYVEVVIVDTPDWDSAHDAALEVTKGLKLDNSTFKFVSYKDTVGEVLDINV